MTERDAFGTTVHLTAAGTTLTRQLVAGDGFHASNERRVMFGLGDATRVERLVVAWPAGRDQVFENLAVNQDVLIVEGRGSLFSLAP
jgi:hypothetical protein